MSAPARRAWVALGFGVVAAAAGLYAWVSRSPDVPLASDVDRALGLDHAAVHLHLALRRELHRNPTRAEELRRAPAARPVAERWADRLLDRRVEGATALAEGRDVGPVLGGFGSTLAETEHERVALLFALAAHRAGGPPQVPLPIAVYEASRVDPSAGGEGLSGMVHAARALVYSSADLCERARAEADASTRAPTAEELADDDLRGLASNAATVAADLEHARRFLVDGAVACCAVREGAVVEAAKRIEASAADAAALGVRAERVAILRAFAATARGDRTSARALVDSVRAAELEPGDRERHRMIRDALASPDDHGLSDAMVRLVDRDWLLALVLEGVVDALERDGLHDALAEHPAARAAIDFVAAEASVLYSARALDPLFDRVRDPNDVVGASP